MSVVLLAVRTIRQAAPLMRCFPRLYSQARKGEDFTSFDELVSKRRNEAQRSMLVEVAGFRSAADLHQVCSEFGSVKNMFHYRTKAKGGTREMILLEYEDSGSLENALNNSHVQINSSIIPVHSTLLWLAASKIAKPSQDSTSLWSSESSICTELDNEKNDMELFKALHNCSDISQQIQTLYDSQKLTELGWRLRFFTCRQIEVALSGMFPRASVLPFGSSVNSFGRRNCDLDMILELTDRGKVLKDQHRLIFQAKQARAAGNPRITMQRHMEVISDLVDNFVPGCSQVRKILNARIPIIKYYQYFTGIECDLSMSNRSGFYMSEMLYQFGCMDPRVRPLVYTVRCWAKDRHMTSPFAGRWITNFSLTILVLFYLTRTSPPVIPPLQTLIERAGPSDYRETNGIDCTFLRDLSALTPTENTDSLETLLRGFFEFYDKFDFKERGLSIVSGNDFVKPEHKALYIQNPLERELNVSHNVTFEEIERLSSEVTHARYLLEGLTSDTDNPKVNSWGILQLCSSSTHPVALKSGNIAIDWKDFFSGEPEDKINVTSPTPGQKLVTNDNLSSKKSSTDRNSSVSSETKPPSPPPNKKINYDSVTKKSVNRTATKSSEREQMLKASDLNNLVTNLKRKAGNKSRHNNKKKTRDSGRLYKW